MSAAPASISAPSVSQLDPERLVRRDHVVERVGDLAGQARPSQRHANAEVPLLDVREHAQQHRLVEPCGGDKRLFYHRRGRALGT
jgi:hypothetical protein